MTHHQSEKHTHVTLHTIIVPCAWHGEHRIIIADLDGFSKINATHAFQYWKERYADATMTSHRIPLDVARIVLGTEADYDDLPF